MAHTNYHDTEIARLSLACGNIARFLSNEEYRLDLEKRAQDATDGNISALDMLIHELRLAVLSFPTIA